MIQKRLWDPWWVSAVLWVNIISSKLHCLWMKARCFPSCVTCGFSPYSVSHEAIQARIYIWNPLLFSARNRARITREGERFSLIDYTIRLKKCIRRSFFSCNAPFKIIDRRTTSSSESGAILRGSSQTSNLLWESNRLSHSSCFLYWARCTPYSNCQDSPRRILCDITAHSAKLANRKYREADNWWIQHFPNKSCSRWRTSRRIIL